MYVTIRRLRSGNDRNVNVMYPAVTANMATKGQ